MCISKCLYKAPVCISRTYNFIKQQSFQVLWHLRSLPPFPYSTAASSQSLLMDQPSACVLGLLTEVKDWSSCTHMLIFLCMTHCYPFSSFVSKLNFPAAFSSYFYAVLLTILCSLCLRSVSSEPCVNNLHLFNSETILNLLLTISKASLFSSEMCICWPLSSAFHSSHTKSKDEVQIVHSISYPM